MTFLAARTGGVRFQAVAVALFRSIGETFQLFERVDAATINAADASTGSVADLTCIGADGEVVLAVEVKDRELQSRHVEDKLPAVRVQGVREILFVITGGLAKEEKEAIAGLIDREFVTGQNVYVVPFDRFLESCLVLFGEGGRRRFLVIVGDAIDDANADLAHRQAWRDLLRRL
jgi:hypothetical protein